MADEKLHAMKTVRRASIYDILCALLFAGTIVLVRWATNAFPERFEEYENLLNNVYLVFMTVVTPLYLVVPFLLRIRKPPIFTVQFIFIVAGLISPLSLIPSAYMVFKWVTPKMLEHYNVDYRRDF